MIVRSEHTVIVGSVAFQVELWSVRDDEAAICSPVSEVGTLFYCVRHGCVLIWLFGVFSCGCLAACE
jgi:hypothetical protein